MAFGAGSYGELYILPKGPDTHHTVQVADAANTDVGTGPFTATMWRMLSDRRGRDITPLGVSYTLFAPQPYVVRIAARGFWDGVTGGESSNTQWLSRKKMYCKLFRKRTSPGVGGEYLELYAHWMKLEFTVDVSGMVMWQGVMRIQGMMSTDSRFTNEE